MADKVRFALIGASEIAPVHIRAIKNCPQAELYCLFSRDINRAKKMGKEFGLLAAQSYEEILKDKTIHAVDIVTEPSRHGSLALEAMKNGKHVLIEKPLDTNILQAKRVYEESEKVSTITSVMAPKRFDPVISRMKRKLENGIIGKAYLAELKLISERTEAYYHMGNGWRSREGNILINIVIHYLYIFAWLFGFPLSVSSRIKKIKKNISCYDTALVTIEFPGDILLNIVCSTACNKSLPVEFKIFGTKGYLSYSLEKQREKMSRLFRLSFFDSHSLFERQIKDFIQAIIHKTKPTVTVKDAFDVLEIIEMCERGTSI